MASLDFSERHGICCVVVARGDTPDDVIHLAEYADAIYDDGIGDLYCVQIPGRPQELYTEEALRESVVKWAQ